MQPGDELALPPAADHHARRVLRLRDGADIRLFDGAGNEYAAKLRINGNDSHSHARVLAGGPCDREARLPITLVQALCAQDKVDWLLEKCVELGAARIVLAPAARSVVRLDSGRGERRLARWREIVAGACAQCGRNRLPEVTLAADLATALQQGAGSQACWMLDPQAEAGLQAGNAETVTLAVGPEGGFEDAERALAARLGYRGARLGPRVLRTETAGLAAISALLAERGEWR